MSLSQEQRVIATITVLILQMMPIRTQAVLSKVKNKTPEIVDIVNNVLVECEKLKNFKDAVEESEKDVSAVHKQASIIMGLLDQIEALNDT